MAAHAEIFTICDAASIRDGSISILNTYNTFKTDHLPATKKFTVAISLWFDPDDIGEKELRYEILDQDLNNLADPFPLNCSVGTGTLQPHLVDILTSEVEVPAFGDYIFRLSDDSGVVAEKSLYVRKKQDSGKASDP